MLGSCKSCSFITWSTGLRTSPFSLRFSHVASIKPKDSISPVALLIRTKRLRPMRIRSLIEGSSSQLAETDSSEKDPTTLLGDWLSWDSVSVLPLPLAQFWPGRASDRTHMAFVFAIPALKCYRANNGLQALVFAGHDMRINTTTERSESKNPDSILRDYDRYFSACAIPICWWFVLLLEMNESQHAQHASSSINVSCIYIYISIYPSTWTHIYVYSPTKCASTWCKQASSTRPRQIQCGEDTSHPAAIAHSNGFPLHLIGGSLYP